MESKGWCDFAVICYNHAYYCYTVFHSNWNGLWLISYWANRFVYLIPKVVFYWISTGICVAGLSLFWLVPFSMDQRFEQSKIIWECFMLIMTAVYWDFYIGCIPRFCSLKYVTLTALDSDHNSLFKLQIYNKINQTL